MPLIGVIQAASADADVGQLHGEIKAQRLATDQVLARDLATKKGFNRSMSPEAAADVIYAVLSHELYGLLAIDRAWSMSEVATFMDDTCAATLFPPRKTPVRRS
jgi:hypothetical protein